MSWYPQNTGLQQQQRPMPPGWEAKWDPTNRRWFYMNHSTKTTQWEDPRLTIPMVNKLKCMLNDYKRE